MPISDIPILSMLRTRMQWHQERQRLLAENVANADTPEYRSQDLAPLDFSRTQPSTIGLVRTAAAHMLAASDGASGQFESDGKDPFEVRPAGNAVNVEDEMMKVASNQMDYQAATQLYTRSLGLIKLALDK
jgi:flagellar basal-body rod protein FlgB